MARVLLVDVAGEGRRTEILITLASGGYWVEQASDAQGVVAILSHFPADLVLVSTELGRDEFTGVLRELSWLAPWQLVVVLATPGRDVKTRDFPVLEWPVSSAELLARVEAEIMVSLAVKNRPAVQSAGVAAL